MRGCDRAGYLCLYPSPPLGVGVVGVEVGVVGVEARSAQRIECPSGSACQSSSPFPLVNGIVVWAPVCALTSQMVGTPPNATVLASGDHTASWTPPRTGTPPSTVLSEPSAFMTTASTPGPVFRRYTIRRPSGDQ